MARKHLTATSAADLKPGTPAWRVNVAMCAHQFFRAGPGRWLRRRRQTEPPPVGSGYGRRRCPSGRGRSRISPDHLSALGLPAAGDAVTTPTRILSSMNARDFCCRSVGTRDCQSWGRSTSRRGDIGRDSVAAASGFVQGVRCRAHHPELYNAVTVQLAGHDDAGNPVDSWGTSASSTTITSSPTNMSTGSRARAQVCPSYPSSSPPKRVGELLEGHHFASAPRSTSQ